MKWMCYITNPLNMEKIKKKQNVVITAEESFEDIVPIKWNNENEEPETLECIAKMCNLVQKGMKESRLTEEIIEKSIPKQVTHEASIYSCYTCPRCKNVINERVEFCGKVVNAQVEYCNFCGQHLKWE